jgi:lipid A ethanolaminephosphotransferase
MKQITNLKLIILVSLFLVIFGNFAFFSNTMKVYPPDLGNLAFLLSLAVVYFCIYVFFLSLICFRVTIKPLLIIILILSSITAYFMDSYNVVINSNMIDNVVRTDPAESLDLISLKAFVYLVLLGIVPSLLVYKIRLIKQKPKQAILYKISAMGVAFCIVILCIYLLGSFYAPFFREHKQLRYYANPAYYIYSIIKYVGKSTKEASRELKAIGLDAKISEDDSRRELIILVVGESARADRFSLNGYSRKTNPLLEQETLFNFSNAWSCGTTTAVSVPCMFSIYDQDNYDSTEVNTIENMLDVLQRAGVNVIWLDNNSDSKGVALRVPFENYKSPDENPICDIECRDEGMLSNLQAYIDEHTKGDILIILHQMGNHGPSYFKRYPKEFERFTPACQTNQLEECRREEIDNAYDNALLYTDYFLSKTIALLKQNSEQFDAAMIYVSDHGESLGENNLYLHGLPNMIAPDDQIHIPLIMWFGKGFDAEVDLPGLSKKTNNRYSHDNLFHTTIGLFELETTIYDPDMDIIDHH